MNKTARKILFCLLSALVLLHMATSTVQAHTYVQADADLPGLSIVNDNSDTDISHKPACSHSDHKRIKAARICQRYHERLLTLMANLSDGTVRNPFHFLPAVEHSGAAAYYNKFCLSSCYDYIFRLSPF
jgi:hypothetical protein